MKNFITLIFFLFSSLSAYEADSFEKYLQEKIAFNEKEKNIYKEYLSSATQIESAYYWDCFIRAYTYSDAYKDCLEEYSKFRDEEKLD